MPAQVNEQEQTTDFLEMLQAATNQGKTNMTDQERVDAVLSTPFFMTSLTEDAENKDIISALNSLQWDGTPDEVAENFKAQGNACFRQGKRQFKDAIVFYTKGIQSKCRNESLNSVLFSNRAAVHLELGNYGSCLNDCAAAIRFDMNNLKAYYRSVKSLYALDRVDEGIEFCHLAMVADPDNVELQSLLVKLQEKKERFDEMERLRIVRSSEKAKAQQLLSDAILASGYRIKNEEGASGFQHPLAPTSKITLDAHGLSFPVLLLYPEFNQSDFISSFHEKDTFYSHFENIFQEAAPWDTKGEYSARSLDWYFEANDESRALLSVIKRVGLNTHGKNAMTRYVNLTLGDVLKDDRFTVVNGVCTFIILSRDNDFVVTFKEMRAK